MGEPPGAADWLVCDRTRSALEDLDPVLREAVTADDLQLRVMALHVVERGGKRLRPALLLLSASLGSAEPGRLLRAAAALELTHVASLYHDDVMDRAALRRSGPTTNARWGDAMAAFAGTYLFARASELWASLGAAPNELASRGAVDLCAGQLHELENAYDLDLSEEAHLRILEQKTATLFELPCRVGAELGDLPSALAEALASFGRDVGLAFQLADDALDLTGDARRIGKPTGNDLREGIYSLPVLRALGDVDVGDRLRELLARTRLTKDDLGEARRLVRESGAVDDALDLAGRHARRAKASIEVLPPGAAKDSLRRLADFALERSF